MKNNELRITGFVLSDSEQIGTKEAAKFAVAVDRYTGKGREKKSDIFNVSCWTKRYQSVLKNIKKGKLVNVSGTIVLDKVEGKIYPEVHLDSFQLVQIPEAV